MARSKIVFFGAGPLAAKSLEDLYQYLNIEKVVTKPRAKHHKGPVPVLDLATKLGLEVHTVTNKEEINTLFENESPASDLGIVVDFGIIISKETINMFKYGILNSHFSILPEFRGADPITFSILSGNKQTGVSLMSIVEKMDEGPLYAHELTALDDSIKTSELTRVLLDLSNSMLRENIPLILSGEAAQYPQSKTGKPVSYSRKITKSDGIIDWNKSSLQINREIRAFDEWPKSRAKIGDIEVIITESEPSHIDISIGDTKHNGKSQLLIGCGNEGSLEIKKLKPLGKREMTIESFLAGYSSRL